MLLQSRYRDIIYLQRGASNAGISSVLWDSYKMYFLQGEHNPPHIHAIYNDDVASTDYMTGEVLVGYLPTKALKMVREWIDINRDEIQKIWGTQEFKALPSLE